MECSHEINVPPAVEAIGDSEEGSVAVSSVTIKARDDEEEDDAESCIDGDGDDGSDGDEGWGTWRQWCEESAKRYEKTVVRNGCDAPIGGGPTAEMEENRLFWEACLANEYSDHT